MSTVLEKANFPDNAAFRDLLKRIPPTLEPQAAPKTWECALKRMPPPCRVLVVGAGRGGLSWILNAAGYDVTSIDLHPDHFAVPELRCEAVDVTRALPYPDQCFDAVLAIEVVEHLEAPWFFLREAIRVLRPKAPLVFTSPNVNGLIARLLFLRKGVLPYFREESFVGCYHVTPIFEWSVIRWCRTTEAQLASITYSRAEWPTASDIPRHHTGRLRRVLLGALPAGRMLGEISCYTVVRSGMPTLDVGVHYA